MFSFLRQMRWKPFLIVTALGLPAAAFVAPFTPQYHPVAERLEQRFLETEGRARWQIEAAWREEARRREEAARLEAQRREAAERAAAEQRRREEEIRQAQAEQARREAEEQAAAMQRQQLTEEYNRASNAFHAITRQNASNINIVLNNVRNLASRFRASSTNPAFYTQNGITVEEVSSQQPCANPIGFSGLFELDRRTRHNLFACAVHYATNAENAHLRPIEYNLSTMIFSRLEYDNGTQLYPIHWILMYAWITYYQIDMDRGFNALPPLIEGDQINRRLLNHFVTTDFVRLLLNGLSTEERLTLRNTTYPQLLRLSEVAMQLRDICRRAGYNPCLPAR